MLSVAVTTSIGPRTRPRRSPPTALGSLSRMVQHHRNPLETSNKHHLERPAVVTRLHLRRRPGAFRGHLGTRGPGPATATLRTSLSSATPVRRQSPKCRPRTRRLTRMNRDAQHEHHDGDNEHLELENHENPPQVSNQDTVHVLKPAAGPGVPRVGDLQDIEPVPEDPTGDLRRGLLHDKASSSWNSRMGPERGIRFRSGAPPVPPKWSYSCEDVRSFAKFERKVQLWRMQIRAWMPLNEAAMLLYGALTGEAEDETENLDLEKVNSPGGLDYIMNSLKDGLQSKVVFQKRKLLHDFESVSRYNNESMRSYTSRYRRTEQALQSVGIQVSGMYDEEARGSRLLDRAKLTPESQRLVLIGCGYRLDFASISDSLNMSFPEHTSCRSRRTALPRRERPRHFVGTPWRKRTRCRTRERREQGQRQVREGHRLPDRDDTEEYQDFPEEGDEHDPGHGEDAQEPDREDVDLQGLA